MIQHYCVVMDVNSDRASIDGSCGLAILNGDGEIVGFFRLKKRDSRVCYVVSSEMLIKAGYRIAVAQVQN
jgi:hypothetical protein